jgi:amino acid transporter
VPWQPFIAADRSVVEGVGVGLAVAMWNYSGWDTPSTCLGETKNPERAFRSALLWTLPIISVAYLLPVAVGLASGATGWTEWKTGTLPAIASGAGGAWLGHAVAAGAVLSAAGLFMSLLLTNSRLPFVLARDGMMPAGMGSVAARTGVPWLAVVASAALYAAFAAFSFKELIVLNVWLYSLSLLVELAAFLALRRLEPLLARPWRVPGGAAGALLVTLVPAAIALLAMATAGWTNTLAGAVAALTGPAAYVVFARRRDSRR